MSYSRPGGRPPGVPSPTDYQRRRQSSSARRVGSLLRLAGSPPFPSSPYGLGDRRSLASFFSFVGLDVKSRGQLPCGGESCCPEVGSLPVSPSSPPGPLSPPSFYLDESVPSYALSAGPEPSPSDKSFLSHSPLVQQSRGSHYFDPSQGHLPYFSSSSDSSSDVGAGGRMLAAAAFVWILLLGAWCLLLAGRRASGMKKGLTEKHRVMMMNPMGEAMKHV